MLLIVLLGLKLLLHRPHYNEPNQNVIMQGLLPLTSNSRQEFRTRLARNLNSGDTIFLCLRPVIDITNIPDLTAQLNFAICY